MELETQRMPGRPMNKLTSQVLLRGAHFLPISGTLLPYPTPGLEAQMQPLVAKSRSFRNLLEF
jgi:hypothetical protein